MAGRATDGEQRIALAAVAGAHGIKGEVRLKLFSDSAESLMLHPKLLVGEVERKLTNVRAAGKGASRASKRFRSQCRDQLRGSLVEIERDAAAFGKGEYYHAPCSACRFRSMALTGHRFGWRISALATSRNRDEQTPPLISVRRHRRPRGRPYRLDPAFPCLARIGSCLSGSCGWSSPHPAFAHCI